MMRLVCPFELSSPVDAQTKQDIPRGLPPEAFKWVRAKLASLCLQ